MTQVNTNNGQYNIIGGESHRQLVSGYGVVQLKTPADKTARQNRTMYLLMPVVTLFYYVESQVRHRIIWPLFRTSAVTHIYLPDHNTIWYVSRWTERRQVHTQEVQLVALTDVCARMRLCGFRRRAATQTIRDDHDDVKQLLTRGRQTAGGHWKWEAPRYLWGM